MGLTKTAKEKHEEKLKIKITHKSKKVLKKDHVN
jgi:hypothetical protein